jgi:monoamine oxidase
MDDSGFASLPTHQETQIVIVGAGISGLYCAWRLLQDDPTRRITIIERLNRTGGRLDTDIIQVRPGQVVREEEGGMRFNYAMTELMRLNHALGLCDQVVPFPMSSAIGGANTNRFLLRGRRFTAQEADAGQDAIWGEIYNLADTERGKSPARIIQDVYDAVLQANGQQPPKDQTPEFWTRFRNDFTWNGTPLRDWQLWGLLRDMGYSQECVQMLSETIGFAGPFLAPINAGDALQILADFPVDPTYFTFQRGFSTLPDAVRDQLAGKVEILLSTNVDRITRMDSGFALALTEAPGQQDSNPYIPGGQTKQIACERLILAVAANGLERLFVTSPALNGDPDAHRLWESIHASRGMRLMKINLYFADPWWLDGGITPPVEFGPNFSSLPVNAVYPFYSLAAAQQVLGSAQLTELEATHVGAAALTIYCDLNNTAFWEGLQNVGPKFNSELQERHSIAPQTIFPASDEVVGEASRQLAALFGIQEVPEPLLTSYRLWDGNDDFEFAYHQWRVGVDDAEVRGYLSAPVPGMHVANEAVSDMQGWVNGSLRSSDLALSHFGIAPMDGPVCQQTGHPHGDARGVRRVTGLWGA